MNGTDDSVPAPAAATPAPAPAPSSSMKLPPDQWIAASSVRFNVSPEVLRAAMGGETGDMSADDVDAAITAFLNTPVGQ